MYLIYLTGGQWCCCPDKQITLACQALHCSTIPKMVWTHNWYAHMSAGNFNKLKTVRGEDRMEYTDPVSPAYLATA